MKKYIIEIEYTVAEFFEEVAGILSKPTEIVMRDVLFIQAEKTREDIIDKFSVSND